MDHVLQQSNESREEKNQRDTEDTQNQMAFYKRLHSLQWKTNG
jgi:hypothetical protein